MDRTIPMTETYLSVENLIYHTCNEFVRQCHPNAEYEDIVAEANTKFVDAYENFDPSHGVPFSSYLPICIRRHLISRFMAYELRSKRRAAVVSMNTDFNDDGGQLSATIADTFVDNSTIWNGLSEDASMLVDLVLQAPGDIANAVGIGASGAKWRRFIKEHLLKIGWDQLRIKTSFKEIQEALQA